VLRLDDLVASQARQTNRSERLEEVERAHFVRVLERCGWKITGSGNAADALGMRPSTLRARLKKLGVARPA